MNRTEELANDLPLAAIPAATEVAAYSGGKINSAFADRYGVQSKNADEPRNPNTAVNEDQHALLSDVKEAWDQAMASGGIEPATMLYMHPWEMRATGPLNEGIVVPACPIQDEFIQFTQRTSRFDFGDAGGRFKVRMIFPVSIMRDFQRQHFSWGGGEKAWGGVVVYPGDRSPGAVKEVGTRLFDRLLSLTSRLGDPDQQKIFELAIEEERKRLTKEPVERLTDSQLQDKIQEAKALQLAAYEESFDKGEQAMASFMANQKGAGYPITRYQRSIAQWLFHRGRIKKLPAWVTERRPRGWTPNLCKKCGTELNPEVYACGKCGRIHDAIAAFKDGDIKSDNPALKRCTREQLDAIGLTDVLTLEQELATTPDRQVKDKEKSKKGS